MLLPVVAREMLVQARRKGIYRLRAGAAVVALGLVAWLVILSSANLPSAAQGQAIFTVLSTLSFIFCLLVGIRATSDCLSEEKREETLGLLFLTDLRSHSIVLGKVTAGSLSAFFALLAVVPVLSLAVLLGGVTLPQIALTAVVLLNTMFLSLAAGAFVSALSRNERSAMLATFVLMAFLVFTPFGYSWMVTGWNNAGFVFEKIWPSPIFSFLFVSRGSVGGGQHLLLPSLLVQHATAWLLLGAASVFVRRSINTVPTVRFQRIRAFAKTHVYGSAMVRRQYRARLLDRNAFLWLAARERIKPRYAWVILGLMGIGWMMMYFSFPRMVFDLPVSLLFLFFAHFIFKLWAVSEVCSRLIEDRRSGALELLLSTPLSVREIVQGQSRALRHIFFWPIVVLLGMEIFLLQGALGVGRQGLTTWEIVASFTAGASIFLLDLWAIKWLGMWHSLFATSIERILLGIYARLLALPWLLFSAAATIWFLLDRLQQVTLTSGDLVLTWWWISAVVALPLGWSARVSFLRHFRTAAAQRFEPGAKASGSMDVWLGDLVQRFRLITRMISIVPGPIRRHWVLSGIALSICLVAAFVLGRQWLWRVRVDRQLAAIRAEGYPTTMAEIAKFYPPVSAADNAATALRAGGGPTGVSFDLPLNVQAALAARKRNQSQLNALLSVTNYSRCYLEPSTTGFPSNFGAYHAYAQLGLLEMNLAEHDADLPRALAAANSMLHLAHLLREMPTAEGQMAAFWQLHQFSKGLENLLAHQILPEQSIQFLIHRLEALENPDILHKFLVYHRWFMIVSTREQMQFTPVPFAVVNSIESTAGSTDKLLFEHLSLFRTGMAAAELPIAERYQAILSDSAHFWSRSSRAFAGPGLPWQANFDIRPLIFKDLQIHAQVRILKTALALSRWNAKHGEFPDSLQDLVPEYLPEIPVDPFTAVPLGYTPGENALLFSPGDQTGIFMLPDQLHFRLK